MTFDIFAPLKIDMANMLACFSLGVFCRYRATSAFIWSFVCGHLMNVSPTFLFLLTLIRAPSPTEGNIWLKLYSIYQVVANIVHCLVLDR